MRCDAGTTLMWWVACLAAHPSAAAPQRALALRAAATLAQQLGYVAIADVLRERASPAIRPATAPSTSSSTSCQVVELQAQLAAALQRIAELEARYAGEVAASLPHGGGDGEPVLRDKYVRISVGPSGAGFRLARTVIAAAIGLSLPKLEEGEGRPPAGVAYSAESSAPETMAITDPSALETSFDSDAESDRASVGVITAQLAGAVAELAAVRLELQRSQEAQCAAEAARDASLQEQHKASTAYDAVVHERDAAIRRADDLSRELQRERDAASIAHALLVQQRDIAEDRATAAARDSADYQRAVDSIRNDLTRTQTASDAALREATRGFVETEGRLKQQLCAAVNHASDSLQSLKVLRGEALTTSATLSSLRQQLQDAHARVRSSEEERSRWETHAVSLRLEREGWETNAVRARDSWRRELSARRQVEERLRGIELQLANLKLASGVQQHAAGMHVPQAPPADNSCW